MALPYWEREAIHRAQMEKINQRKLCKKYPTELERLKYVIKAYAKHLGFSPYVESSISTSDGYYNANKVEISHWSLCICDKDFDVVVRYELSNSKKRYWNISEITSTKVEYDDRIEEINAKDVIPTVKLMNNLRGQILVQIYEKYFGSINTNTEYLIQQIE